MIIKADPPHFTILAVSDQFLNITHRKRSELLGQELFKMFPGSEEDDSEMQSSIETFEKAIKNKKRIDWPNFRYEIFNEHSGKMEVQYWSNYHEPILDDEGEVTHIINTTLNITDQLIEGEARALAEKKLKASEENLRNMVNQAPVGMCILSGDPLYVNEVNDAFLEVIGKRREDFYTTPYWEVNAEAAAFYRPITDEVLRSGNRYQAKAHEVILVRNGTKETVFVDFVYEPMKDLNGVAYAILIVAIEITHQVMARRELENAYEQLRLSKEAAELGTFDLNLCNGEMHWDQRCRLLFGIRHNEPVNYEQHFIGALHPADRGRVTARIAEIIADEGLGGNYDLEFRSVGPDDGITRWVRAKGKIFFHDHMPQRFIGSVLDITNQKEDEQRKNDFIGMVSHELKTPLTSLMAYQQMLRKKLKGTADSFTKVALDKSNQQVRKMTSMINGFLNISHLESGKIKLIKEEFDVRVLLEELIDEFLLINTSHSISLHACGHALVYADREKISSVISNLISNAIKYSPNGKNIEITCDSDDQQIRVSIKDEGMGIKESDRHRLFERFYRISTSHRENISGFGIGLYLSKEIIQRHSGKIWVESESGKGSTFTFSLPVNSREELS